MDCQNVNCPNKAALVGPNTVVGAIPQGATPTLATATHITNVPFPFVASAPAGPGGVATSGPSGTAAMGGPVVLVPVALCFTCTSLLTPLPVPAPPPPPTPPPPPPPTPIVTPPVVGGPPGSTPTHPGPPSPPPGGGKPPIHKGLA